MSNIVSGPYYCSFYIIISFWACSGLALSLVTRNVAGQTKKRYVPNSTAAPSNPYPILTLFS